MQLLKYIKMDDVSLPQMQGKHGDVNYELDLMNKFLTKLLVKKAEQCKHKDDCVTNAVKGFFKNVGIAYAFKVGGQIVLMLMKNKLNLQKILKNLTSKDSMSFALFLGSVSFLFKAGLCFTRRFNRTHDKYNAVAAGLIWSIAALADRNISRRQQIIFYLASRVLESTIKLLDRHDVVRERKDWGFWVMYFGGGLFAYQLWCEKDTAIKSAIKTFDQFACLSTNDKVLAEILHKRPY